MKIEDEEFMWDINGKLDNNERISEKEKFFFNTHLTEMINEMYKDYEYWLNIAPINDKYITKENYH